MALKPTSASARETAFLPPFFILYLVCALKESPDEQVFKDLKAFLDVYYADDLTYATTSNEHRTHIETTTPAKLKAYNLFVNMEKTEKGEAPDRRPPPPPPPMPDKDPGIKLLWSDLDWTTPPEMQPPDPNYKEIKLLGTKLDTKRDITARKNKVWQPIRKMSSFFRSKRLSTPHKVKVFRS